MSEATPRRGRGSARYSESGAAAYSLLQELDRIGEMWSDQKVSRGRLTVLRILATEGSMTMSDVARQRNTSRQGVGRLTAAMVEEGWLAQDPNPRHRRAPLLRLTSAGLAAYQVLAQQEADRLNEIARGLPAEELRSAARVIEALRIRGAAAATASPMAGPSGAPDARAERDDGSRD